MRSASHDEALATLRRLVAQPSINAQGIGMMECAALLRNMMATAGIDARIIPTEGYPVVYGQVLRDPQRSTVLFYGYYDVQPPEPEAWESPPFQPTVRNGRLYGRGTGDNKGQLRTHSLAVQALHAVGAEVPRTLVRAASPSAKLVSPDFGLLDRTSGAIVR